MKDEGYIKFNCNWIEEELPNNLNIDSINFWRQELYDQSLIGAYDDGIGYGNISQRLPEGSFFISGTATGKIKQLTDSHYTCVTSFDVARNTLICHGPVKASSESLTHAIVYESLPEVNAVVHIHNKTLWDKLLYKVPTTSAKIEYGTPEMANEINRLLAKTNLKEIKVLAMAGHEDGIIAFGKDLEEAANIFLLHPEILPAGKHGGATP